MPEGNLTPPTTKWIGTRKSYVDDLGRRIDAVCTVHGSPADRPADISMYLAHGVAGVQTPEGPCRLPFQFAIEAETIVEAFDKYDELKDAGARDFIEKMNQREREMHEAQAKQLVMPSGVDVDAIAKSTGIQRR